MLILDVTLCSCWTGGVCLLGKFMEYVYGYLYAEEI